MKTLSDAIVYRNRSLVPPPPPSTRRLMHRYPHHPKGSMTALLRKTGPFDPTRDVFGFKNIGWGMTKEDARILRERYMELIDATALLGIASVTTALKALSMTIPPFGTIGLPAEVITYVVNAVSEELRNLILEMFVDSLPGEFGRCGGMAFAALDFFAIGWSIKQFADPHEKGLRDYIWSRLIDSIELNGVVFLDWVMNLHVMPIISRSATAAIGAAAGQLIGGPMGAAIGTFVAAQGDVLNLGGPGELRERTQAHFTQLQTHLDREAAWPIGLVYEGTALPYEQHQILALGYSHGDKPTIDIWDNNDNSFGRRIKLDFGGDALKATEVPPIRPCPSPPHCIPQIKGIICESYAFQHPPETLHFK